jgi:hypothetical protein
VDGTAELFLSGVAHTLNDASIISLPFWRHHLITRYLPIGQGFSSEASSPIRSRAVLANLEDSLPVPLVGPIATCVAVAVTGVAPVDKSYEPLLNTHPTAKSRVHESNMGHWFMRPGRGHSCLTRVIPLVCAESSGNFSISSR